MHWKSYLPIKIKEFKFQRIEENVRSSVIIFSCGICALRGIPVRVSTILLVKSINFSQSAEFLVECVEFHMQISFYVVYQFFPFFSRSFCNAVSNINVISICPQTITLIWLWPLALHSIINLKKLLIVSSNTWKFDWKKVQSQCKEQIPFWHSMSVIMQQTSWRQIETTCQCDAWT